MKTIEYRVQYTGANATSPRATMLSDGTGVEYEVVRVQALNINGGYAKALKIAKQPLGNGKTREIGSIEFWKVV